MAAPCARHLCQTVRGRFLPLKVNKYAPVLLQQQCMGFDKHRNPKFRKLRGLKVFKMDLPDLDEGREDAKLRPDQLRMKWKKEGKLPPRTDQDKVINISSTNEIYDAYVPPEGDGKSSIISGEGSMQRLSTLKMKGLSLQAVRRVKKYEEDFNVRDFAEEAQRIYVEAQTLLNNFRENEDKLHEVVTERAYPQMTFGLEYKTIRWEFVEAIEPPYVVHVRTKHTITKDNIYAQVTVRLHTKQKLAIYDRFGRLMYGSENLIKDVLEYVVLEKHIVDLYGRWRVHGKVIPEWLPPREPLIKTYRKPVLEDIPEGGEKDTKSSEQEEEDKSKDDGARLATT